MSNGQVWKIHREIDCHSVNVMYIWNVKCITKKEHIGKTIGDNTNGFKVRRIQHTSDCKTGVSTLSSRVMYAIVVLKNDCLEEPFVFQSKYHVAIK